MSSPINPLAMLMHRATGPLKGLVLLLLGALVSVQAIYPDGHFDHVTKISDADQLSSVIDEALAADQTLFVRWIASAG